MENVIIVGIEVGVFVFVIELGEWFVLFIDDMFYCEICCVIW